MKPRSRSRAVTSSNDFIHAGVLATMADHTAGGAAGTLVAEGEIVLTAEFKISLLRPAVGERVRCRATVLEPGRTLSFVESEVWTTSAAGEKLVAKATVTIAVVTPRAAPWMAGVLRPQPSRLVTMGAR